MRGELAPGMHETCLHRARRHAEDDGDFRNGEPVLMVQGKRDALGVWQASHGEAHGGHIGPGLRLAGTVDGAAVQFQAQPLRQTARALIDPYPGRRLAGNDPPGPGGKGGRCLEPVEAADNVQPGVLQDVMGLVRIIAQTPRMAQQVRLPQPGQAAESGPVPGLGTQDKILAQNTFAIVRHGVFHRRPEGRFQDKGAPSRPDGSILAIGVSGRSPLVWPQQGGLIMPGRIMCACLMALGLTLPALSQPRPSGEPPQRPLRCDGENPPPACRNRAPVRPAPNRLGGGDPGWEVRETQEEGTELGGGDPGWEVRQGDTANEFGGEDPGWVTAPEPVNRLGGGDPGWELRQGDTAEPASPAPRRRPQRSDNPD